MPIGTGEDHGTDVGVMRGIAQGIDHAGAHFGVEGVAPARIAHGQHERGPALFNYNAIIGGHRMLLVEE